jgi:spermidine/putrescine-binding protein
MNARTAGKAGFRMTTVIALVLALAVVLSGCSRSDEPTLYVYNWSDYTDEDLISIFSPTRRSWMRGDVEPRGL